MFIGIPLKEILIIRSKVITEKLDISLSRDIVEKYFLNTA